MHFSSYYMKGVLESREITAEANMCDNESRVSRAEPKLRQWAWLTRLPTNRRID